jgi:hypothetical protein
MISSPMLGIMSPLCLSSRRRSTVPRASISGESCMQSLQDISTQNYRHQNSETERIYIRYATYEIAPAEYSSFGICGTPHPSTTGEISKAARTEATVIHIDERAMNRPGHIRRPNPKPTSGSFTLRSRKRSGWNRRGSGKTVSSCSTALKNRHHSAETPVSRNWPARLPRVSNYDAACGEEIAFIHVIHDQAVRNRWRSKTTQTVSCFTVGKNAG